MATPTPPAILQPPHLQQQPSPQVLSHVRLPSPPTTSPLRSSPLLSTPTLLLRSPELHKRINKLVEYSAKNGPDFKAMIREKQQDNPDYAFLSGGEGHGYYRYKLYASTRVGSFNPNPQFAPRMVRPQALCLHLKLMTV
ncbi:uncharacterized protein LOC133722930 [Rosa rugosa]|uniref:uncharacterized protein LOC133722930 n=1 Tax=Rosa rugosa TaxID=74645 RepID=UPI002B40D4F2|nr:uncharacterized protein LOC133722930 [Rosa rugosa]